MIKVKVRFKVIAFGLSSLLVASGSHAETISEALKNCGQVQNSLKRLVCYDKIVDEMNRYGDLDQLRSVAAPLAASPVDVPATGNDTPTVMATDNKTKTLANDVDFGLEQKRLSEKNTDDKIYTTVVKIQKNARKNRVFTLSNGHVWRETEGGSMQVKVDEAIYIERGALGSFHLSKDNSNRRTRVKRVK